MKSKKRFVRTRSVQPTSRNCQYLENFMAVPAYDVHWSIPSKMAGCSLILHR